MRDSRAFVIESSVSIYTSLEGKKRPGFWGPGSVVITSEVIRRVPIEKDGDGALAAVLGQ